MAKATVKGGKAVSLVQVWFRHFHIAYFCFVLEIPLASPWSLSWSLLIWREALIIKFPQTTVYSMAVNQLLKVFPWGPNPLLAGPWPSGLPVFPSLPPSLLSLPFFLFWELSLGPAHVGQLLHCSAVSLAPSFSFFDRVSLSCPGCLETQSAALHVAKLVFFLPLSPY